MPATVDIAEDQLYTLLGQFLLTLFGPSVPIVRGQVNRVPAPPVSTNGGNVGYILMQLFHNRRVRTNEHTYNSVAQSMGVEQGVQMRLQLDFYGPDAHDQATIFSTLWRDDYGCAQLAPTCAPLYADDAAQGALIDGEEQYDERWTVQAFFQYNPVITVAQQSATALDIQLISVDERYPP